MAQLTPAEVFDIADDLATFLEDEEIGAVLALVEVLVHEQDFHARERLSKDIERAMMPYSMAYDSTYRKLTGKAIRAARRRLK